MWNFYTIGMYGGNDCCACFNDAGNAMSNIGNIENNGHWC